MNLTALSAAARANPLLRSKAVFFEGKKIGTAQIWDDVRAMLELRGYRQRDPRTLGDEGPDRFVVDPRCVERVR